MPATANDAPEYNGMRTYYLITFLVFGLLSLNCFGFSSTWANETCLVKDDLQAMVDKELANVGGGGEAAAPAEADPAAEEAAEGDGEEAAGEETTPEAGADGAEVDENATGEENGRLRFLTTDK